MCIKPYWIVEQNVFAERIFDEMIAGLKELGNPYSIVKVIPFVHEIDGKLPKVPENTPVVVYGSIGCQKLAQKHNWLPGVWTGDHFNVRNYKEKLGDLFLNSDAEVMPMSDALKEIGLRPDTLFMRPNQDTKEFAGTMMLGFEFVAWYQKMQDIGYLDNNDFEVAIASPKPITAEYRFVVVKGNPVSYCTVKEFGVMSKKNSVPGNALKVVFQSLYKYQPEPVYVIDIAQINNGENYKVIEYNTFNSAGLYNCNPKNIISAINERIFLTSSL